MSTASYPPSRQERQEQTRSALLHAARAVFARDGYHSANLEGIAREAGFSKGAVYSNFEGKSALFLAVMDLNMEAVSLGAGHDPFERVPGGTLSDSESAEMAEMIRGFALATLEFFAMAARDEKLLSELSSRLRVLIDAYTELAERTRSEDDPLSAGQLSALMVALDQGIGVLALGGGARIDPPIDQRALRTGMRRLLNPARALDSDESLDAGLAPGEAAFYDDHLQRNIARSIRPEAGDDQWA